MKISSLDGNVLYKVGYNEYIKKVRNDMIKLVAIDMDGTLLSMDHTISEVNQRAIHLARAKGVKIVLCSGRTIHNLLHFAKELGIEGKEEYVVGYNGAGAVQVEDEVFVYDNCLTGKEAKAITKICDGVSANYTVHTFHKAMTLRDNVHSRHEAALNGVEILIEDPEALEDEEVVTKVVVLDDPEVIDAYEEELLRALSGTYHVVRTMPIYLEIMRKGVNKFIGTMAVAKELGFKSEEIMALGDAMNDYELLSQVGLGVAMENGVEAIKSISNFVTRTNEEHGVAYALNHFLDLNMEEFQ